MSENAYENFRTILTVNLCSVIADQDLLRDVLNMVDISIGDFAISKKPMEIIPACNGGLPEVVKYFLAARAISNLSKGTLKQYRYKLDHFFKTVRKSFADVTANDIRIYLFNFKSERSASDSYVENIRITLNSFFSWLVDNEYLSRNPCANVDKIKFQAKPREALTSSQLEQVRWNTVDIREKALVDFLFSTGCRVSECAGVRLSDINWNNRSVNIRHGKGDKHRVVYFNSESELTLKEYLKTRDDDTDALFVGMRRPHRALGAEALESIIRKIATRSGIKVYPHKLRHTFATMGLNGGMPLHQLQALMGHSRADTTLIYAKINQDDLQMEHQRVYS